MPLIEISNVRTIAVVGCGTIGASWAAWFLGHGYTVRASDPDPARDAFIRDYTRNAWPALVRLGAANAAGPDAALARLSFDVDPVRAVTGCDFVQESALEREDLKQALLARLDKALPANVVISSSTSGFMPSVLQQDMGTPERLVVGHPFNPPHLVPLVEVIGGRRTAPATVTWAIDFYRHIGKHPIRIEKEVAGHVANRLQAAIWREAVHLVNEGVASVADVDAAIAYGPGLRWAIMGPAHDLSSCRWQRRLCAFPRSAGARRRALVGRARPADADPGGTREADPRHRRRGRRAQHGRHHSRARPGAAWHHRGAADGKARRQPMISGQRAGPGLAGATAADVVRSHTSVSGYSCRSARCCAGT